VLRIAKSIALGLLTVVVTVSLGTAFADDPPGGDKKKKGKAKNKQKQPDTSPGPAGRSSDDDSPTKWSNPPAGMDSRIKEILIDLRGQFNTMDVDTSWSLEASELARGFRGPKATVPEWGFGIDATSEAVAKRPKQDEIKKRYPDQYFLNTYDLDRDGKVTKREFQDGFMDPVVSHYEDVFKKKDELDKIVQRLQLKTIDRVQRAKLEADMKILNNNLWAGRAAFRHAAGLEHMSARNAQWRTNVAWYNNLRP
jgi:hypothetical protein